jgi:hypothetical protein
MVLPFVVPRVEVGGLSCVPLVFGTGVVMEGRGVAGDRAGRGEVGLSVVYPAPALGYVLASDVLPLVVTWP